MPRLCALAIVLFALPGCMSDPSIWEAAKRDLRGDNSQMRSMSGPGWGAELPRPTMKP